MGKATFTQESEELILSSCVSNEYHHVQGEKMFIHFICICFLDAYTNQVSRLLQVLQLHG